MHWSLGTYFMRQEYADIMRKSAFIRENAWFLPACVVFAMLSGAVAILFHARWYYLAILPVIWAAYGVSCTELAIARLRREGHSRREAISRLNRADGGLASLETFLLGDKYPFP